VSGSLPVPPGFIRRLGEHGDRPALLTPDGDVSYTELADAVECIAERLGPRRRLVLVEGANELGAVVGYLAALRAGHPVLLAGGDRGDVLQALVSAYEPDVVVRGSRGRTEVLERRSGAAHDLHPDLALLLSTSGSTGSPKLVRLSAENVEANAASIVTYLDLTADDRAITTLPLHYCYGLSVLHSHLWTGATVCLTEASVVDPCFWQAFHEHGVTGLAGVPHTFDLLDRVGFGTMALPSLRYVTQAGGRLEPERVQGYARQGRRDGWRFFVMYGQTEATARMAYLPPELAITRPEAIGIPIPGGSFTIEPIEDPSPDEAGDSTAGELVYCGPNVMLGYADSPADLAEGRTVEALRTGDLARRTQDGLYVVTGRRSRFLKLFGLRVDLERVEAVLADTGVSAVCSGDDRQLVVGAVRPVDPDGVAQLVRDQLGLPPSAVRVVTLDELPRLSNGKLDRRALTPAETRPTLDRGGAPVRRPTVAESPEGATPVQALVADVLHRADVDAAASFVELGGDSLSYVEASVRLEALIGDLPPDWHLRPIGALETDRRGRRRIARVETDVAVRAMAIVAIVAGHVGLFTVKGGAHLLLVIAGLNLARFHLAGPEVRPRRLLRSTACIAVPSIAWIAVLLVAGQGYGLANVALVHTQLAAGGWGDSWRFWFIEALVMILLAVAILLSFPTVRRLERRQPFTFACVVLAVGLVLRFELVVLGADGHRLHRPQTVLWLFALGWAIARARTAEHRLLVSAVALLAVPGFFDNPARDAVVLAGALALVWVSTLPVIRPVNRLVGLLAGASLYIYLTHWVVYPWLEGHGVPALPAVLASLVVGVGAAAAVQPVVDRLVPDLETGEVYRRGSPADRRRRWTKALAAPHSRPGSFSSGATSSKVAGARP